MVREMVEVKGLSENKKVGKRGGAISRKARLELEEKTGKKVISNKNFLMRSKGNKKLK